MDLPSFFRIPLGIFSINAGLPSFTSISTPHALKPSFTAVHWYTLELFLILSYTLPLNRSKNHHLIFYFGFLFLPIIYFLLFYRMDELENFGNTEWGMGCRLGALAMYSGANLAVLDPLRDMRKVEDWEILEDMGVRGEKREGEEKKEHSSKTNVVEWIPPVDWPFLARLWWGLVLWGNPRGINMVPSSSSSPYKYPSYLPPRPSHTHTRQSFIFQRLLFFLVLFALYDLNDTVNLLNPYYMQSSPAGSQTFMITLLYRVANLSYGVSIYLILEMECTIFSLFSVSFGISKPYDWPRLFGDFRDAWSLRRLWGRVWHQMFRRPALVITSAFLRFLRLSSLNSDAGSPSRLRKALTNTVTLFSVFFITGLMHHAGDTVWMQSFGLGLAVGSSAKPNRPVPGALQFFLLQAVGVLLEDVVGEVYRNWLSAEEKGESIQDTTSQLTASPSPTSQSPSENSSPSIPHRVLGYLWVIAFLTWSLPFWVFPIYEKGYVDELPHPRLVWGVLKIFGWD